MEQVNKNRHAASCMICQHEKRADIEADYLHWLPYRDIMGRYFPDRAIDDNSISIFKQSALRHARVFGLEQKRTRNVLSALGVIAERGLDSLNGMQITPKITLEALKEISNLTKEKEALIADSKAKQDIPGSRNMLLKELLQTLDKKEDEEDEGSHQAARPQ